MILLDIFLMVVGFMITVFLGPVFIKLTGLLIFCIGCFTFFSNQFKYKGRMNL